MKRSTHPSRRRFMASVLGAAGLGAVSIPAWAEPTGRDLSLSSAAARIPANRIGAQLYTLRAILSEELLGLEGGLELLQDAGISNIELFGNYSGRSPREFRELAAKYDIRIAGNHVGPRTMDGENPWYDESGREQIFAEARELGLEYVGTGHYYNVPLTVEGFTQFARTLNTWGAAASRAGLKFYFHNHNGEFTRFDGRPIFNILLEETDPELVYFELDLAWTAIAGEDVYEIVRQHQHRFPLFHVKDFRFVDNGPRSTMSDTLAAGRTFTFTDVGKGEIDWARLFGGLENPAQHIYLIERDDAGSVAMDENSSMGPTNPAGPANTIWVSSQFLHKLTF